MNRCAILSALLIVCYVRPAAATQRSGAQPTRADSVTQLRDRLLEQVKAMRAFNRSLRDHKDFRRRQLTLDRADATLDRLRKGVERCFSLTAADITDTDLLFTAQFYKEVGRELMWEVRDANGYLAYWRSRKYKGAPTFSFDEKKIKDLLYKHYARMHQEAQAAQRQRLERLAAQAATRQPAAEPTGRGAALLPAGMMFRRVGPQEHGLEVDLFDSDEEVAKLTANPDVVGVCIGHTRTMTTACVQSLARYPCLTTIKLQPGTLFRGKALLRLAEVTSLRHLTLSQPNSAYFDRPLQYQVTDTDLAFVAKLPQLESVEIQGRHISGGGIAGLARLPRLTSLTVYHPYWRDDPLYGPKVALLSGLADAPRLERLTVHAAQLSTRSLQGLARVKKLRELELRAELSAPALDALHGHPSLEVLRGDQALSTAGLEKIPRLRAVFRGPSKEDLPFLRSRNPATNEAERLIAALAGPDAKARTAAARRLRDAGPAIIPDVCADLAGYWISKDSPALWAWRVATFGENLVDAQSKPLPSSGAEVRPGVIVAHWKAMASEDVRQRLSTARLIASVSVATGGAILPEVAKHEQPQGRPGEVYEAIARAHLAELEKQVMYRLGDRAYAWNKDPAVAPHVKVIRACRSHGASVLQAEIASVKRTLDAQRQRGVGRLVTLNKHRASLGYDPISLQETMQRYVVWAGPLEGRRQFLEQLLAAIQAAR